MSSYGTRTFTTGVYNSYTLGIACGVHQYSLDRGDDVNTLRQVKGSVPLVAAALVVIAIAFFAIGRVTSQAANTPAPTPTATRIIPTPTPKLTVLAPHILAAWLSPSSPECTNGCYSFTFTSTGPVTILAALNPYGVFAGSAPSYTLSFYNSSGHLLDQVTQGPFDPNQNVTSTDVIPEALTAGSYQIQINEVTTAPMSVLVLSASQQ